jgi:hypothetical protein
LNGRKRHVQTEEDIASKYATPEDEDKAAAKRRKTNKRAAALRLKKRQQVSAPTERRIDFEVAEAVKPSCEDESNPAVGTSRPARRTCKYRIALANHEDFVISRVSGLNVVDGRHELPKPTRTCADCQA